MQRFRRHRLPSALGVIICLLALAGCQAAAPSTRASATPHFTLTYAVIGASDAWGVGTDDPDRLGWPTVLAGELSAHTHLVNLGIPGATVAAARQLEVPIARSAHPDLITVWLGVNDYAQHVPLATFASQLGDLLMALRQGTTTPGKPVPIYVGNLPDLALLPFFQQSDPTQLARDSVAWNSAIARECAATGALVVDIHTAFAAVADQPGLLSGDGLHPSDEGARLLAQTFLSAIQVGTAG